MQPTSHAIMRTRATSPQVMVHPTAAFGTTDLLWLGRFAVWLAFVFTRQSEIQHGSFQSREHRYKTAQPKTKEDVGCGGLEIPVRLLQAVRHGGTEIPARPLQPFWKDKGLGWTAFLFGCPGK